MEPLSLAIVLFLLGLGVLAVEVFVPSYGVLTVTSVVLMLLGCWQLYVVHPFAGAVGVIVVAVVVPISMIAAIRLLPRTPWGGRLIRGSNLEPGPATPTFDLSTTFLGHKGKVITPLRPMGICRIDDQRLSCFSEGSFIDPGADVVVVGTREGILVVRVEANGRAESNENSTSPPTARNPESHPAALGPQTSST